MPAHQSGYALLPDLPGGLDRHPDQRRTFVWGKLMPVYGQTTIFSLPHACLAAGLLDDVGTGQPLNWSVLLQRAQAKWQCAEDCFLSDAAKLGISPRSVERRARAQRGAIIGWQPAGLLGTPTDEMRFGICPDLELTVAVLSCCISDIFFSARAPDFSWATLFGRAFACDDDLGPAPALDQAPWQQYAWEPPEPTS